MLVKLCIVASLLAGPSLQQVWSNTLWKRTTNAFSSLEHLIYPESQPTLVWFHESWFLNKASSRDWRTRIIRMQPEEFVAFANHTPIFVSLSWPKTVDQVERQSIFVCSFNLNLDLDAWFMPRSKSHEDSLLAVGVCRWKIEKGIRPMQHANHIDITSVCEQHNPITYLQDKVYAMKLAKLA